MSKLTQQEIQDVKRWSKVLLLGYALITAIDDIKHTPAYRLDIKNKTNSLLRSIEPYVGENLDIFFSAKSEGNTGAYGDDEQYTQDILLNLRNIANRLQEIDIHNYIKMELVCKE